MLYERFQNCRLIVDLNHLAHRHWATTSTLANSRGQSTGAIFGPLKSFMMFSGFFHPAQVIAVRDDYTLFRRSIYPDYKRSRLDENRTTEEKQQRRVFHEQLDALEIILLNLGVPVIKFPLLEADDLAAQIAHLIPFKGETILVSGDKDYIQLVKEGVALFSPMLPSHGKLLRWDGPENLNGSKKDWVMMRECGPRTYTKWVEKLPAGIPLERWLLYRLLTGDTSDELYGAHGIGPAAALKIIQRFYSYEVFKEAGEEEWSKCLSQKQVLALKESIKSGDLDLQYQCIDLSYTVKMASESPDHLLELTQKLQPSVPDTEKVRNLFRHYEMASLLMDWQKFIGCFPAFYDYKSPAPASPRSRRVHLSQLYEADTE